MPGTNAKMNEIQALMGEQMLGHLEGIIERRKNITELYRKFLQDAPGLRLAKPVSEDVKYNYAYFPIEIDESNFYMTRDELYQKLKLYNVFARRYFYPLVSDFACYK